MGGGGSKTFSPGGKGTDMLAAFEFAPVPINSVVCCVGRVIGFKPSEGDRAREEKKGPSQKNQVTGRGEGGCYLRGTSALTPG